ncbi:MAG: TraB/GumN family protein [Gammaproteobacteria bacterium]|nr:TraB/GumN family protein [Gammaproteobacteria bacterium]
MPEPHRNVSARAAFAALALCAAAAAQAEPALWRVSADGRTVWLFGSVHLLPAGGFTVDGALEDAFRAADRVCMEIDNDAVDQATQAAVTLGRAVDPEGRDLFELLGPEAGRVRAAAEDAGVPIDALAMFEPWFAGITVSVLALQSHGYDMQHGVEQVIQAAAREAGKSGCGLETLDGQLAMLDTLSPELQAEILLQELAEAENIDAQVGPMVDAWRAGDLAGLEDSLAEDFAKYPELAEILIYRRNERWAGQVDDMMEGDEDVLLVVGAMHLVGERGLPALLAARGHRVERR